MRRSRGGTEQAVMFANDSVGRVAIAWRIAFLAEITGAVRGELEVTAVERSRASMNS